MHNAIIPPDYATHMHVLQRESFVVIVKGSGAHTRLVAAKGRAWRYIQRVCFDARRTRAQRQGNSKTELKSGRWKCH